MIQYKFTLGTFFLAIVIAIVLYFGFTEPHLQEHTLVQEPLVVYSPAPQLLGEAEILTSPDTIVVDAQPENKVSVYEEIKHWFPQLSPFLLMIFGYYFDKKKKQSGNEE